MQLLNKHEDQLGRGLTYELWKNFPAGEILIRKDSNEGVGCQLDLGSPPYAPANTANLASGGGTHAFTDATSTIGGLTHALYSGGQGFRLFNTADNSAAEVQWGGGAEPFCISDTAADARELIFECQFRVTTITTAELSFFIGLASAGVLAGDFITDAGADVADLDMIGLAHMDADTTGVDVIYQIAGSGFVVHEADWGPTLAVNTWYTFGMRYLPNIKKVDLYWGSGDRTTSAFVKDDNPILSTDIDDATFPDGQGLAPIIATKAGSANDASLDIRAMACAQVAYPAD